MLVEDMRVEESDPADASEEMEVDEVTLSESNSGQRRQRRELVSVRTILFANHRMCPGRSDSDNARSLLAGQGSLTGRCGPIRC